MQNYLTWQIPHHRGLQTVAVWNQHAPALEVDSLTLAQHTAAINALPGMALLMETAENHYDTEVSHRDSLSEKVKDYSVRLPRLMDGMLEADDKLHRDLEDIRSLLPDSLPRLLTRGQKVQAAWEKFNAVRAAAVPPKPPVLVGTVAVATFAADLAAFTTSLLEIERKKSAFRGRRTDLQRAADAVDEDNKRWYAAWEGNFSEGSPEREALNQIDTGSGGGEPTVPEALVILSAVRSGPDEITLTYDPDTGDGADVRSIEWKVGDETDFLHGVDAERPVQVLTQETFANATVTFRTRTHNAQGDTLGEPVTVEQ